MSQYQHTRIKHTNAPAAFVTESAQLLIKLINDAIAARGRCLLGLSGGSTPGPIYTALGTSSEVQWDKVFLFLVDERYIAKEDKNANHNMLLNTILKAEKPIPEANRILLNTTLPIAECVADYGARLQKLFHEYGPADVLTLGMGPDGHIASLFPPVVPAGFQAEPLTVNTQTEQFAVRERVSLTLPVIQAARAHVFFFNGADKEQIWNTMLEHSSEGATRWPALPVLEQGRTTVVFNT
ncbi:6-phosphogluconolactonase [Capsaspora owczarzaki ATCC 30864]|uniref:6-phosphogluconolactonase n=1 Tax=Capsaspora owczarzaki (strain ATCC 30864) TaxID=595528 RepID=A0A0D2VPC6_CAPO3|nr:6-phosphogluconolactonase [Capsaspora owczarzaki ATCC 30864]KJE92307.1 6-phosphogluconolactonase [Capsaspora owczarzaki ATCC 30864]|eukprot:XP_004364147.1 6-phosphogluconolactonase [Capsaspora owczarzaki ATCC 30864]